MTLESKGIIRHKEGKTVTPQSCGHSANTWLSEGPPGSTHRKRIRNWFWGKTEDTARPNPRDIQSFCGSRDSVAKEVRAWALEPDYWV